MERPPFIDSQRLWHLDCPEGYEQACLRPETLWALPRDQGNSTEQAVEIHGLPPGTCKWRLINPPGDSAGRLRHEFLSDLSIARLCVTIDAGVGKTTALRQTEWVRQTGIHSGCLAVLVDFAELPGSVDMILGSSDRHADDPVNTPLLIWKLKNSPKLKHWPGGQLRDLIERLIRRERFTLLVDSLDQSAELDNPLAACRALRDFLQRYPEVRCVVSGRPFAVRRYWNTLFQPQAGWQFVKLDVFTQGESERFVGAPRLAHLTRLGADVISIPRSLEMVRLVPADSLSGLRTKSDVYYQSLEGLLRAGLDGQASGAELGDEVAWKLFSLLAFEMLRAGYRAGLAGLAPGPRKNEFLDHVWTHQETALRGHPLLITSPAQLDQKLGQLLSVNEHLVDPVLAGRAHPEVVHFFWRNQALMDMFAALWVTRYAEIAEDLDWFGKQLGEQASHELCQLAVEMPLVRDGSGEPEKLVNSSYVKMMGRVFESSVGVGSLASERRAGRGAEEAHALKSPVRRVFAWIGGLCGRSPSTWDARRRWTEWIYRGWPNMLELSRFLMIRDWTENEVLECTLIAQRIAWESAGFNPWPDSLRLTEGQDGARELLLWFLGEYPSIVGGARGARAQSVATEIENAFRGIPPDDTISRTLRKHLFLMSATQVTNAQYELFDPSYRKWGRRYSSWEDRSPVIYVRWYEAWCFSLWSGSSLPTEWEWEYACRAGASVAYCFGDEESELGKYAWYRDNSSNAHPVGEKQSNAWGLYDMHGNVNEWCDSWLEELGGARVIRGGGWQDMPRQCRTAYRDGRQPSFRHIDLGFRLARNSVQS